MWEQLPKRYCQEMKKQNIKNDFSCLPEAHMFPIHVKNESNYNDAHESHLILKFHHKDRICIESEIIHKRMKKKTKSINMMKKEMKITVQAISLL